MNSDEIKALKRFGLSQEELRRKTPVTTTTSSNVRIYPHHDCLGKQAFPTKAAALEIERKRERRKGAVKRQGAFAAYRCPHCHQWHLGHRPKGLSK